MNGHQLLGGGGPVWKPHERGEAALGESAARRTFLGEKKHETTRTRIPPAPLGGLKRSEQPPVEAKKLSYSPGLQ